mgnify:CR=1 FL=1
MRRGGAVSVANGGYNFCVRATTIAAAEVLSILDGSAPSISVVDSDRYNAARRRLGLDGFGDRPLLETALLGRPDDYCLSCILVNFIDRALARARRPHRHGQFDRRGTADAGTHPKRYEFRAARRGDAPLLDDTRHTGMVEKLAKLRERLGTPRERRNGWRTLLWDDALKRRYVVKYYIRLLGYLKPYVWPYFILGMVCMLAFGATRWRDPIFGPAHHGRCFRAQGSDGFILFAAGGDRHLCLPRFHELRSNAISTIMWDCASSTTPEISSIAIFNPCRCRFSTEIRPAHYSHGSTAMYQLVRYAITDALASFLKDATSLVVLMVVAFLKDWVLASIASPLSFRLLSCRSCG